MLTFKRNDLGQIEVHKDSQWLAYLELYVGSDNYELYKWVTTRVQHEVYATEFSDWELVGEYATLKEAYKTIKERLS